MEQPIQFYCLKCNELASVEKAEILFRTGYYRRIYPLGCCGKCGRDSR